MVATATATTLRLNGFRLEPSTESFKAYRTPMPADGDVRELRRSRANDWILYRKEDELLAVPLHDAAPPFGEAVEIRCQDHLGFLGYLIDEALPKAIPSYPAFRLRPFSFLGQRQEIVAAAVKSAGAAGRSPLVDQFHERPRYELATGWSNSATASPSSGSSSTSARGGRSPPNCPSSLQPASTCAVSMSSGGTRRPTAANSSAASAASTGMSSNWPRRWATTKGCPPATSCSKGRRRRSSAACACFSATSTRPSRTRAARSRTGCLMVPRARS